nr:hypothetical protein [Micromonospora sp. DSM 115978]
MTRTSPPIVPTTFHDALRTIQCASSPAALFGQRAGIDPDGAHQRAATRIYHHVARLVHPDRAPHGHAAAAQAAFVRLGQLWEQYQRHPVEPARSTVRAGGRVYTVGPELGHGQVADLHRATYRSGDGREVKVVLKT